MITRKEYNNALDTIEAYHKQLFIDTLLDLEKTPVLKWDKFKNCSKRLQSALRTAEHYNSNYFIEDMHWNEFRKIKNAGKKCWSEFVELRGY
jgi:hypothetical protein